MLLFGVCLYSSKEKPNNASVKVQYRGNWFYIRDNDMQSKYTLMLLNQISALQIFPVPTVDANAVINAENCEISPSCSDLLKIILKAKGSDLN